MHSCELIAPPPAQGAALLLELGTLIIEGRNPKPGRNLKIGQCVQLSVSDANKIDMMNSEMGRGALPKRSATSLASVNHLSPAKRNRDHDSIDRQFHMIGEPKENFNDHLSKIIINKHPKRFAEEIDPGKIASTSKGQLSAYELKARLANVGCAPLRGGAPLLGRAEAMWRDHKPLCIEVLLAPDCYLCHEPQLLLERWTMSVYTQRSSDTANFITSRWLLNAVRSQLHFSQISAWSAKLKEEEIIIAQERQAKINRDLSPSERQRKLSRETCNFKKYESNCDDAVLKEDMKSNGEKLKKLNIMYKLVPPDQTYKSIAFQCEPLKHTFPITDIGSDVYLEVQLESLPRLEDIPKVKCKCQSIVKNTPMRRKSKEMPIESSFTEDILSRKLAAACCLVDKRSTNSDAINLDTGSTNSLSRKFPIYSSPNVPEFGYHSLSSKGSTPERTDVKDVLYFNTHTEPKINTDTIPNPDNDTKSDDSYQSQFIPLSNDQVPLNKLISTDYLLVDDRMQTPCRKKGKHRCNCDDESDQGASKDNNRKVFESNVILSGNSHNCDRDYLGTGQKVTSDEKKIKEMTRNLRRQRKENRLKHLTQEQQSGNDTSPQKTKKNDTVCGKKIRTTSSSENSDGRNSPELVHYHSVCHGCFCKHQEQQKRDTICNSETYVDWHCSSNTDKNSDSNSTTSIPILQASKFDHLNRFGCFRNGVSRTSREFYCSKPQNVTIDQRSPLKSLKNSINNENSVDFQKCYCHTIASSKINDDDYRPSVKKLISSATQTDDMLCECGNLLVSKCPECKNPEQTDDEKCNNWKMKRSDANHDLAAITKTKTTEACGSKNLDSSCRVSHGEDDRDKMALDKKVIDFNCDNSVNILNNCECDKNILYSDSFKTSSCTNESLLHIMPLISDSVRDDVSQFGDNALSTKSTDLSILVTNKSQGDNVQCSEPNSHIKTLLHKEKPPDIDVKTDFVIKKPKLKKSTPTIDKISIIVKDRNDVMSDGKLQCDDEASGVTDTSYIQNRDNKNRTSHDADDTNDEDQIILYEKGDYGTFSKTEERNGNCIIRVSDAIQNNLLKKYDLVKKKLFRENGNKPVISQSVSSSENSTVPSTSDMDKFRYRLDSAASMVFHSRTGLPLTSSPAPLRKGKSCFDYDSTINSVSGIKSALYGLSSADLETQDPTATWSPSSSPGSPSHTLTEATAFNYSVIPKTVNHQLQSIINNRTNKFRHGTSSGLLGSFEESVLNGRLEPAATVAGFTAEIGASGEFCPPHLTLPVTVFFYSLGDNTTSSPYLGHINLGRKGYCVPRAGTIQVTLFNPHGTVVKMFVVMYNLEDMPPHSRTFLRQRTLWGGTCLRYLIHLRFLSSKSGKLYLHTDIRIIVSRKADLDTAAAHSLSSFITNTNNNCIDLNNKKYKVETGTFKKRIKKCDLDDENNKKGSDRNGVCDQSVDVTKAKRDINQNRQTFPINRMNLPSMMSKELSYELRSFTYGPENPKYSPR